MLKSVWFGEGVIAPQRDPVPSRPPHTHLAYFFTFFLPQTTYHPLMYYVFVNLMSVFCKNINPMEAKTLPNITIVSLVTKLFPKHSGW